MSAGPYNPGDIFLDKYRIERVLGAGAMGIVLAAVHLGLAQRVAIKFMLPGKAPEEQLQRFLREARACALLKTAHATRVLDVGTTPEGAPYMVMEYLDGRDLAAELAARGPLPVVEAVELILQACEAIAEAHAAGIVHRDIKPANMFVARDPMGEPCVKVLDFGISKINTADLALTSDVQTLGSPLYMSPEQINCSKDVDARTDIWALGASLYELVAGKTPFFATKMEELCTKVYFKPPTPLSAYCTEVPPGFEGVLFQCFEKERERRYPSVAGFAAALVPFGPPGAAARAEAVAKSLGERVATARPTNLLPAEPAATTAVAATGLAVTGAPLASSAPLAPPVHSRKPIALAAGAVIALALAAVGVGFGAFRGRSPSPAPTGVSAAVPASSTSSTVITTTVPPPAPPSAQPPAAPASSSAAPPVSASAPPASAPGALVKPKAPRPTPPRSPSSPRPLYGVEE